MHGFGPAILHAIPSDHAASLEEIQAGLSKQPSLSTVKKHVADLKARGVVQQEGRGLYRRLLESEDLGVAA